MAFLNIVAIPLVAVVLANEADVGRTTTTTSQVPALVRHRLRRIFCVDGHFFTYGAIDCAPSRRPRAARRAGPRKLWGLRPRAHQRFPRCRYGNRLIAPLRRGLFSVGGRSPLRIRGTVELLAADVCVAVLVGASLANVDLNALAAPDKSARDAEAPPPPPAKRSVWGAVYAVRGIISGFVIVRLLFVPAIVSGLEALATAMIPIPQARLGRAVLLISSGMPTARS